MTNPARACPDQALTFHAMVDGELDALGTVAIEEHLRSCTRCRAEYTRIERTRALLSDPGLRLAAPDRLRTRISTIGSREVATPRHRPLTGRAMPWLGGGLAGALAASLALLLVLPDLSEPGLADAVIDGQIRSLQSGHLVDVETSDRHTVKPWFNGRISYAPPVVDLKERGFPLVGGRLDVVARENVAVLVYRRRLHTINLFVRPAQGLAPGWATKLHRAGYSVERWRTSGLEFWAVSDLEAGELDQFRTAFAGATSGT